MSKCFCGVCNSCRDEEQRLIAAPDIYMERSRKSAERREENARRVDANLEKLLKSNPEAHAKMVESIRQYGRQQWKKRTDEDRIKIPPRPFLTGPGTLERELRLRQGKPLPWHITMIGGVKHPNPHLSEDWLKKYADFGKAEIYTAAAGGLQGLHAKPTMIFIDEASDMPPKAWKRLEKYLVRKRRKKAMKKKLQDIVNKIRSAMRDICEAFARGYNDEKVRRAKIKFSRGNDLLTRYLIENKKLREQLEMKTAEAQKLNETATQLHQLCCAHADTIERIKREFKEIVG